MTNRTYLLNKELDLKELFRSKRDKLIDKLTSKQFNKLHRKMNYKNHLEQIKLVSKSSKLLDMASELDSMVTEMNKLTYLISTSREVKDNILLFGKTDRLPIKTNKPDNNNKFISDIKINKKRSEKQRIKDNKMVTRLYRLI